MPTSKFTVPLPEEILAYCHVYCVDGIHIIVGVSYAGLLRSQVSSIRVECHLPENVLVSAGRLGRWIKVCGRLVMILYKRVSGPSACIYLNAG